MSCLFDSLALAVNLHPDILRKAIVAYLATNPALIDDLRAQDIIEITTGASLTDYSHAMSHPETWGGAIELKAYADLFHVSVIVHVTYTNKEFTIESKFRPQRIVHVSYNGNHFEPMYIELLGFSQ